MICSTCNTDYPLADPQPFFICDNCQWDGIALQEGNPCPTCGEPIVGEWYYHECGKHQLRNFWTEAWYYRGVYV